ncbi:hypothetical protein NUW58_g3794 [Xylaria curta]|uniref:Uncharacterized protein n=1 Tax=Xylaria curta TaxID=42375 RepID=A0ACC1PAI4_9PEZI|nr:hypothetical protein NUW58_g3794 [Xylaria curta]
MAPDQANYLDLFANFADGMDHSESESFLDRFSMPNPILESSMSPMMPTSPPHTLAFGNQNDRSSLYSLAGLHRNYFDVIYFSLPFLSEDRFTAELAANPNSPALLALSYAVALVGCTITLQHAHLRDAYYATARNYVEQCERSLSEEDLASFNLFQALLFLIRFEIMNRRLTRAWMTLGRAVRLSKLLGLHRMDRDTNEYTSCFDLDLGLPTTQDPLLLEERRRSFWCLYILESYVRTRTGADCELVDTKKLHVFLPSPGLLSPGFSPLKMPFLDDLTPESSHEISSYAGCVLMVELAMKCFDHGRKIESGASTFGFWDTHYNLVHTVDERITMLQRHMNAKAIKEDPVAFGLYMNLRGTEIYFHEASILYVERTGHPRLVAAESQRRSLATAYKIATVVRLNWPDQQSKHDIFMLQATFIAWPLVMAMKALHRELKHYLAQQHQYGEAMTELVTSLRILMKALDYIEEGDGFWHKSTEDIAAVLLGLHDGAGLDSVAL